MTIPFHVMKSLIENLKALEASDEARKYLVEPKSDEAIFQLLRCGDFKFDRKLYLFDSNPHVTEEMSQKLKAVVGTLTIDLGDCFSYQNAALGNDAIFTDAMRERGYHAGISRPANSLHSVCFVNTSHGIFVVQ